MNRPKLYVSSYQEANSYLASGQIVSSIVSINDPGCTAPPRVTQAEVPTLKLWFDDIDRPHGKYYEPLMEDITDIISFAEEVGDMGGTCLVHCTAGVSRSTAAAITMKTTWNPTEIEQNVAEVFRDCPWAMPNRLMINLADAALGLNGYLLGATRQYASHAGYWDQSTPMF